MGTQNRGKLKSFFLKNSIPTESNFADLIDSFVNKTDDGVLVGDPSADTNFLLSAKPCILSGTLSVLANSDTITGKDTQFKAELREGELVNINGVNYTVKSITDKESFIINGTIANAFTNAKGTVRRDVLSVWDNNNKLAFYISKEGMVGINKKPQTALDVGGNVSAASFTGDGSGLINLSASKIEGRIDKKNLPPADPINISDINGVLTITETYDQKLAGTVSGTRETDVLTGTGIDFTKLTAGQKIRIGTKIVEVLSSEQDKITLKTKLTDDIHDQPVYVGGNFLSLKDTEGKELLTIDAKGGIKTNGPVIASGFTGDGSGLNNLSASKIEGRIDKKNLPPADPVNISDISGLLTITEAYDQKLEGTVSGAKDSETLTCTGIDFSRLSAGQKVRLATHVVEIRSFENNTITINGGLPEGVTDQSIFVAGSFLSLKNMTGAEVLGIDGTGAINTTGIIHTRGSVTAAGFAGDGSKLTNLSAAELRGPISVDNLPPLDFPSDVNGQLTINGAYDQRHEGTVSGNPGSAVLTGTGTNFKKVLADGQKIRVATTVVEILTVTSDTELTLLNLLVEELINQTFFTTGNFLSLVDTDKRNIAQIDKNGDVYTHGKIVASQFAGDGASLVNLQTAQLQGIVPPGQIAQYINLLSDKTVLNGEETATLSWASHSIDELRLHYLLDGQLKALSTKDEPTNSTGSSIGLQQSSFPLNLYQTTTITLTGLRSGVTVYQQQVTITVIQNINQYIAQIRHEGYSLPLVVSMSANRFGLAALNEQNLLKLAGAVKNNNFDRNSAIDSIRDYYKNSGQAWDPSVYDLLLYQVFDGDLQYQINAVIKQLATTNTLPDVLVQLGHQFPIGALTDKNVRYLATGIYGIKAYPLAEIFRSIPQFFRTEGGVWLPQQHGIILQSICSN